MQTKKPRNYLSILIGAQSGGRTRTSFGQGILSPSRLPVPPSAHFPMSYYTLGLQICYQVCYTILMKVCTKCGTPKPLSEYFVKDQKTQRLHAQCKECYKEHRKTYYSQHYAKYSEAYRERAKIRRNKIRNQLHTAILKYLSLHPCAVCGEDDPRVLEFDHIDPTLKSFCISHGIRYGVPIAKIQSEIEKCQVLCANCHKRRTATQAGWYKNL